MKTAPHFLAAMMLCTGLAPTQAQIPPQPMPTLEAGTSMQWQLHWPAVHDRTYFVQYSDDLMTWMYLKSVEIGRWDSQTSLVPDISTEFSTLNAPRMFYRLRYIDPVFAWPTFLPPYDWRHYDHDGDGISSIAEVMDFDLDPFLSDTDGNGTSDGDEDPDGDGFSTNEEKDLGTNPLNQGDRPRPELKVNVRSWTMDQFDQTWHSEPYGNPEMVDVHSQTFLNGSLTKNDVETFAYGATPEPPEPADNYASPTLGSNGWMPEVGDPPRPDGSFRSFDELGAFYDPNWMTTGRWKSPVSTSGWTATAKRFQLITPVPLLDTVTGHWVLVRYWFPQGASSPTPEAVSTLTLTLPAGQTEGPMAMIDHPPVTENNTGDSFRLLPIDLNLRATGKIEPAPENDSYQMCATAGQGDDLGPLPMGTGRHDYPGIAYTAPLQVIGTVPVLQNTNWRWDRTVTYRSWFIFKNQQNNGWIVSVRRPKIGPTNDHTLTDFEDSTPSTSGKIYIYDNSAIGMVPGPDMDSPIGIFLFEKKQFTYKLEIGAGGAWKEAGTLDVGQKIILEKVQRTGVVATDFKGVENSCAVRVLDMTITETEVRAIVGGTLPIVINNDAK